MWPSNLTHFSTGVLCRQTLHILDHDPHSLSAHGWLEDTSKVEKYVMSEDAYAKRANTYKSFKEQKRKVWLTRKFHSTLECALLVLW